MNLYLDASALVKRYVAEPGSDVVTGAMAEADGWYLCRVGYAEVARAVGLAAGPGAIATFRDEWGAFAVIEAGQPVVEHAAALAVEHGLRTLDALHLAAALALPVPLRFATWDRRQAAAAVATGLTLLADPA